MSHDLAGMLERQQLNVITSYLDASTVYGSNMNVQNKLRAFDGFGRLKVETRFTDNGMHYMPGNPKQPCVQSEERKVSGRSVNCFLTGVAGGVGRSVGMPRVCRRSGGGGGVY